MSWKKLVEHWSSGKRVRDEEVIEPTGFGNVRIPRNREVPLEVNVESGQLGLRDVGNVAPRVPLKFSWGVLRKRKSATAFVEMAIHESASLVRSHIPLYEHVGAKYPQWKTSPSIKWSEDAGGMRYAEVLQWTNGPVAALRLPESWKLRWKGLKPDLIRLSVQEGVVRRKSMEDVVGEAERTVGTLKERIESVLENPEAHIPLKKWHADALSIRDWGLEFRTDDDRRNESLIKDAATFRLEELESFQFPSK